MVKPHDFCELQLQACVPFVRQSMKLVGAAFGSRFLSCLASRSCYSGFASTGYIREDPRVATRLDRGRSWLLPAPGAQTWDQCIEGFSFWAGDVSVWQSFDGLQLAFGKTAWYCARWQTWDQCIEGFSFWAEDVSVWQSFDGLQLAFGKTAWYCARCTYLGSMHWRL